MGRYEIQDRNATKQTAKDDVIEILINEQPKHDSSVYPLGVALPFS